MRGEISLAFPSQDGLFVGLTRALRDHPELGKLSLDARVVWDAPGSTRVLHLQWPEELLGWDEPGPEEYERKLKALDAALNAWRRSGSIIVVTRHNRRPHVWRKVDFRKLYDLVYGYAHGVVHLGRASLDEFNHRTSVGIVIPLSIFENFPDTLELTRAECRTKLGLPVDAEIVYCFGRLREVRETKFLIQCFRALPEAGRRKHLFVSSGGIVFSQFRVFNWLKRLWLQHQKNVTLCRQFVSPEAAELAMKAADVLFLPRFQVLSSGPIIQAITWGTIAVGPSVGVVGEILGQVGNPTFPPGSVSAGAKAIRQGLLLASDPGAREANRLFASRHWQSRTCAQRHVDFYKRLLSQPK